MDTPLVSQQRVTDLLVRWSHGDDRALAELAPLIASMRQVHEATTGALAHDHRRP